jgi:hypothetical protein
MRRLLRISLRLWEKPGLVQRIVARNGTSVFQCEPVTKHQASVEKPSVCETVKVVIIKN